MPHVHVPNIYIQVCIWYVYIYVCGRYIHIHHMYHMYHMIVQIDVCLKQTHMTLKLYMYICTYIPKHVFYIWKYERICKHNAKILKDAYELVGETLKWILRFMLYISPTSVLHDSKMSFLLSVYFLCNK